jgi:hypothetical protein
LATHPDDLSIALELTVTAKGQVTLRRAVLDHINIMPGAKVSVSLLENGQIELVAATARDDIKNLRGALRRSGRSGSKKCRKRSRRATAGEDRHRHERPRPPSDIRQASCPEPRSRCSPYIRASDQDKAPLGTMPNSWAASALTRRR